MHTFTQGLCWCWLPRWVLKREADAFLGEEIQTPCALHGVRIARTGQGMNLYLYRKLASQVIYQKKMKPVLGREEQVWEPHELSPGVVPQTEWLYESWWGTLSSLLWKPREQRPQGLGEKRARELPTGGEGRHRGAVCNVWASSFQYTLNADAKRIWDIRKVSKEGGFWTPRCLSLCPQKARETFPGIPNGQVRTAALRYHEQDTLSKLSRGNTPWPCPSALALSSQHISNVY